MLTNEPGRRPAEQAPPTPTPDVSAPDRIARLTDRQRSYLRLVLQNRNSKEIAAATGSSHRAVDKQLLKANNILGVPTRFDAVRLLADYDGGVEPLPPANDLPSAPPTFPLPPVADRWGGSEFAHLEAGCLLDRDHFDRDPVGADCGRHGDRNAAPPAWA